MSGQRVLNIGAKMRSYYKMVIVGSLILFLTVLLGGCQSGVDAFEQNRRLGRGVNIIGYDRIWRSFERGRFKEKHFKLIKQAGFNTVRINLHSFRHMDKNNNFTLSEHWFEVLDWAVTNSLQNDLMVILDMHEFNAMGDDPVGTKEPFLAFWKQVAPLYKDAPDEVIFEILNEPCRGVTPELWNEYMHEALAIIRKTNPHRTVIIGPAHWNKIDQLEKLDLPEEDDEPEPSLIEVVRDHDLRVAALEQEFAEVMANIPVAPSDDFFARSEPPAGPDEIAGPVPLRAGAGIDSMFTPSGGSFGTSPPLIPQVAVGAEEIEWGIAALPTNRPSEDTCAWMRPEVDGSYGYCYVEPTEPPTSSLWEFPSLPEVSAEGQKGLVKVTFWGAGYARPFEPNVRGGDLVPFIRVGAIAMGIGYLDRPLGAVTKAFNATLVGAGAPEGWILMTNDDTFNMPNTDVTTLGAEITNGNVQQTLFAGAGDQDFAGIPDDEEFPIPRFVGDIDVAFQRFVHAANGNPGDYFNVYGSYFSAVQRVN